MGKKERLGFRVRVRVRVSSSYFLILLYAFELRFGHSSHSCFKRFFTK